MKYSYDLDRYHLQRASLTILLYNTSCGSPLTAVGQICTQRAAQL